MMKEAGGKETKLLYDGFGLQGFFPWRKGMCYRFMVFVVGGLVVFLFLLVLLDNVM